ncbi:APC family permease [Georgenia thermotolerans]|uniref:Amino acid permease n=1 Tax=Georgenia thermotolerans TaxID=527326 RepID=A0A7J5UUL4_9MICO|nr:APC family permease [Georgenia thermotolerans]KAE8765968.1 amino acid permease [Georgenia thermotolerans]
MTTDAPTGAPSRLKQGITPALLFLFILGDVLGAGVYALVGELSQKSGGMIWAPLVLAMLMAMLTAASYAELVTKYPKAGGAAVFARRAFNRPIISFLVGFSMLAAGVTSAAGLAIAFAGDYLSTFLAVPTALAAPVFLVLLALLNARGIKESVRSNVVMTLIEVSGLVLVIVLVAVAVGGGQGEVGRLTEVPDGVGVGAAVLGGALLAFYSFVGFETSANVAEEVQDVRRAYPRALFGALSVAGIVYVAIGVGAAVIMPPEELSGSSSPLLDVLGATGIGVPPWAFSAIALVAVANGALLTMIMSSRLAYGMADEGLLPEPLTRVLPERRTPWVAIAVTTVVALALTLVGDLSVLAETVVLLLLVVFLSTNISVLVLRKDRVAHQHFRTPVVLPVLAIVSCVVLLAQQSLQVWAYGLLMLGVGVVLHLVTRRTSHARAVRADQAEAVATPQ